nr:ISSpo9 transposase [uncultured bacterium]
MSKPEPARYRTTNWKSYNDALKRRGSLLVWLDRDMDWLAPKELCLDLGDAHFQAARLSASKFTSTPSLNLIPPITFGNWFLPLRRNHFLDAA